MRAAARGRSLGAIGAAAAAALALAACAPSAPPASGALSDDAELGAVELLVRDVAGVRDYYVDALGLGVIEDEGDAVRLGSEGREVVRLVASELPRGGADEAGLFHTAILYPDEASLAAVLQQVSSVAPQSFQGASDHRVSQAFYLADPEGNGVELYVDRPESTWEWRDGRVTMGSTPLDPSAFVAEHATDDAPADPSVGHVHLRVGDLDEAEAFYVDAMGFDVTSESPGALFMSVGGYHHHLAVNTWSSAGAGERSATSGLGSLAIALPSVADVDALAERLEDHGSAPTRDGDALTVDDPWGSTVVVTVAAD